MVKLLKFSSAGHDVLTLDRAEAVNQALQFEEERSGRLVNLKTNEIMKSAKDIKEEDEVLLLNQLQGG